MFVTKMKQQWETKNPRGGDHWRTQKI